MRRGKLKIENYLTAVYTYFLGFYLESDFKLFWYVVEPWRHVCKHWPLPVTYPAIMLSRVPVPRKMFCFSFFVELLWNYCLVSFWRKNLPSGRGKHLRHLEYSTKLNCLSGEGSVTWEQSYSLWNTWMPLARLKHRRRKKEKSHVLCLSHRVKFDF